jgi:replicative DNA helicase
MSMVNRDDFADQTLGKLFGLIVTLFQAGKPVSNSKYLITELMGTETLEELGGPVRLAEIFNHAPNAAHAFFHAQQIQHHACIRRLRASGLRMLGQLDADQIDIDEVAATSLRELTAIMNSNNERDVCMAMDAAQASYDAMQAQRVGRLASGIETGIRCVDAMAGTMQGGELVILAARPSIGKTTFAMDILVNAARHGRRGMFVSCEMDRRSLGDRLLSRVTAINCERISRALVTDEQAAALQNAISAWADQPIRIIEASAPTVQQIGAWARAETARYGLDFVVVDHIGLLRSSTRMRNAYESATEIAKDLKSLATALRMPILGLCQLNRDGEGEMPKLSMLRDSGAIEENADKVWFLHRQRDEAATEFIIAKFRNGGTGSIPQGMLVFDRERCMFKDTAGEFHSDFV